jgi:hypothetical protein
MVGLLIGLFIGFVVGGVFMVSDYKGMVAKGYIPYIGKDGTLMWRETPNIACSGLEAGAAESGADSNSPASSH